MMIFITTLFFISCDSGSSNSGDSYDIVPTPFDDDKQVEENRCNQCIGDTPMLNQNWGEVYYIFDRPGGGYIFAGSWGNVFAGCTEYGNGEIICVAGPVIDCIDGYIEIGGTDNYDFTSISGDVSLCNNTLTIENIIVEGQPYPNITGTFHGETWAASTTNENQGNGGEKLKGMKTRENLVFKMLNKTDN